MKMPSYFQPMLAVTLPEDAEAEIVDFEERQHNINPLLIDERGYAKRSSRKEGKQAAGTLGALVVESERWRDLFRVGTGFTEVQRAEIWANKRKYKGKLIKFRFTPTGTVNLPRHPVFLGFRDPRDMD